MWMNEYEINLALERNQGNEVLDNASRFLWSVS